MFLVSVISPASSSVCASVAQTGTSLALLPLSIWWSWSWHSCSWESLCLSRAGSKTALGPPAAKPVLSERGCAGSPWVPAESIYEWVSGNRVEACRGKEAALRACQEELHGEWSGEVLLLMSCGHGQMTACG